MKPTSVTSLKNTAGITATTESVKRKTKTPKAIWIKLILVGLIFCPIFLRYGLNKM